VLQNQYYLVTHATREWFRSYSRISTWKTRHF